MLIKKRNKKDTIKLVRKCIKNRSLFYIVVKLSNVYETFDI